LPFAGAVIIRSVYENDGSSLCKSAGAPRGQERYHEGVGEEVAGKIINMN
jgi:hypothetical protein